MDAAVSGPGADAALTPTAVVGSITAADDAHGADRFARRPSDTESAGELPAAATAARGRVALGGQTRRAFAAAAGPRVTRLARAVDGDAVVDRERLGGLPGGPRDDVVALRVVAGRVVAGRVVGGRVGRIWTAPAPTCRMTAHAASPSVPSPSLARTPRAPPALRGAGFCAPTRGGRRAVAELTRGGHAEARGVRVGDEIVRVGDEPAAAMPVEARAACLRREGPLPLRVRRGAAEFDLVLEPPVLAR